MAIKKIYYPQEYQQEDLASSIFLAGPISTNKQVKSWRTPFIKEFQKTGINCSVFIPEEKNKEMVYKPELIYEWQQIVTKVASAIVFWNPENMNEMETQKSAVDFGIWVKSQRFFYGSPIEISYYDFLYKKEHRRNSEKNMQKLAQNVSQWLLA